MLCASCQNVSTTDRCSSRAIPGLQFCGRHVKVRTPRLWIEVNNVTPKIIRIQKIWRGFSIRNRIVECGLGVLKRSLCHNDDEVITSESKYRQYPLDYFSFEEGGKVFWFDIESILRIVFDNSTPVNPYTRQPITLETRRRLRRLWFRTRKGRIIDYSKIWIHICQMLEENGFEEINPMLFESLNRTQFVVFLNLLKSDLTAIVAENPTHKGRILALAAVKHVITKHAPFVGQTDASRKVGILIYNLLYATNPYPICFAIMSSRTRL
jgi:hypothetical protein